MLEMRVSYARVTKVRAVVSAHLLGNLGDILLHAIANMVATLKQNDLVGRVLQQAELDGGGSP